MTDPELEELGKEFSISNEETDMLEIRKILDKINIDKTVVDQDGNVEVLDISQGILLYCKKCEELQPFNVKNFWYDELWFYCGECGQPSHDVVLHRNIRRKGDRDYKVN